MDASLSWVCWLKRFPASIIRDMLAAPFCSCCSPSWPVTMSISNCSPSILSAWLLPRPSPEARSTNLSNAGQIEMQQSRLLEHDQVCCSAYLSQLGAGLGVCRGKSAMQKSSTVNIPSSFSAPYIAITLPEGGETKQRDEPSAADRKTATFCRKQK